MDAETERLAKQTRIHAKAVEVIAAHLPRPGFTLMDRDATARSILAQLSHEGLLIVTADEFKE